MALPKMAQLTIYYDPHNQEWTAKEKGSRQIYASPTLQGLFALILLETEEIEIPLEYKYLFFSKEK